MEDERPARKSDTHPALNLQDASLDELVVHIRPIEPDPPKQKGIRLQTEKISLVNRRSQSLEVHEMEVQTTSPEMTAEVVDESELVDFLARVMPMMELEMEKD